MNERSLKRAQDRQKRALDSNDATLISSKQGRSSFTKHVIAGLPDALYPKQLLRSAKTPYNSDMCIICQEAECCTYHDKDCLHKVETKSKGEKMYNVAQVIDNSRLLFCLNTLPDPKDVVANDVQYHQCSWVYARCEAQRKT